VALVRSGSAKTQQSLASSPSLAAATLTSLASSADTLAAYAQADNLNPLIALSRDSTAGEDSAYLMAGLLHSLAANSVEIKRAINRAGGVRSQRNLIGGPAGVQERLADALHNLGSNILLTAVAGALLAYLVYSRRTAPARPRAKQVRRPEKEAAERRRRRQAGAAAEASHARAERRWARTKRGLTWKQPRARLQRLRPLPWPLLRMPMRRQRLALLRKQARLRGLLLQKRPQRRPRRRCGEGGAGCCCGSGEGCCGCGGGEGCCRAAETLERFPSLPVMSLAAAQFDTGRRAVPESTIGGQTTCIVCFVNPKSHAAVPCGHKCACGDCSPVGPCARVPGLPQYCTRVDACPSGMTRCKRR